MRLVRHITRKINDDQLIIEQARHSKAIDDLVNDYRDIVATLHALGETGPEPITPNMHGQEFKEQLRRVPVVDLYDMLGRYLSHFSRSDRGNAIDEMQIVDGEFISDDAEYEARGAAKEKRQFWIWFFKTTTVFCFALALILCGAMVPIMTHNHVADNALFKTIMETATELIKIIFSIK